MHKDSARRARKRGRVGSGRSRLHEAVGARGKRLFNIIYLYAPKIELDVVVSSNLAYAHLLWLEADPEVARYDLQPAPLVTVSDCRRQETTFSCLVEFRRRRPELRILNNSKAAPDLAERARRAEEYQAAEASGFSLLYVDACVVQPHRQLICNWKTAMSHQAACRYRSLIPESKELIRISEQSGPCEFDELLSQTDPHLRAVYRAAAFRCLQRGELHSDLAEKPLCPATRIFPPEKPSHG